MRCCQVKVVLNELYVIIPIFLGMLSKSRSHVLRVAAVLHVDPDYVTQNVLPGSENRISTLAIEVAIKMVQLSCQQTAYIAGKMELTEEKNKYTSGICI